MPRPIGASLLGLALALGCHARGVESHEQPARETAATSEVMNEFDPSAWSGRCVVLEGYAQNQKLGPLLDFGGASLGVFFAEGEDWPVPQGSRVRVEGRIAERADLPVFIPDPNEPIMQGMPVPPGTDLEQARRRWVIEDAKLIWARPIEQVEAELTARLGETVELPGTLWSRNGHWWFSHDGVDLHIERSDEFVFDQHGEAVIVHGELAREPRPQIETLGISDHGEQVESFVIRVTRLEPHPTSQPRPCP